MLSGFLGLRPQDPNATDPSTGLTYQQTGDIRQRINRSNLMTQIQPDRPKWDSMIGRDGLLKTPYQVEGNVNTQGMDQLRQEALRTGPSVWRSLQTQGLNQQLGEANAQANAGNARAMDQMAMRGGFRSGAATGLARQNSRQQMSNFQNMQRNSNSLDVQDENYRRSALQNLPGQELALAGFQRDTDKTNVQNALNEVFQGRADRTNNYNEQMRAWAAQRTAAATPSGGGGKK
jgi:hypothetical protein